MTTKMRVRPRPIDPRLQAIRKLQKELDDEREQEWSKKRAQAEVRKQEAEGRRKVIDQRLNALGLDTLFSTGVHSVKWDGNNGAIYEIWVAINGSSGGVSEAVVNQLLSELEKRRANHETNT